MIVLEDFTDYFFIVSVNPHKDPRLGGGTTVISVQANHSDGRKFSHSEVVDNTEITKHGIEQAKALTLSSLLEKINKDEENE